MYRHHNPGNFREQVSDLLTGREIDLLLAAIKGHQGPEGKRWTALFSVSEVAEVQRKLEAKKSDGE